MNEKIMKVEDSYDFYKDEVHCLYEEKTKLNQRVIRAIDYIKARFDGESLTHTFDKDNVKELLDILKGEDNNE